MKILAEIQAKLNAPKGQFNSFGKYKYRSCEDILSAVKPLLNGSTLTISDEIVLIGDRFYVKATASLFDGETEAKTSAYAREPLEKKGLDASQITGSTSSYARKYALNGLFAIDDTKDADTMDNREAPAKIKPEVTPQSNNWGNAIAAYQRDGNFLKIEERATISDANKELIKEASK